MTDRKLVNHLFSWAFRGDFPEIETPSDVDMEMLSHGDSDPMFVTLPFAERNAVASDGLVYTGSFNDELVQQINAKRPQGHMGHTRLTSDGAMGLDVPAIIWLAATVGADGRAWAKGYVLPNKETRDYIRASKATRRGVATSILGYITNPDSMLMHDNGTYEVAAGGFELETLDLAEVERAALKIDRPVQITAQMKQPDPSNETQEENEEMELNAELIAQMTPEHISLLPDSVRDAIVAQAAAQADSSARIAQLEKDNKEMASVIANLRGEVFDSKFDAEVDAALTLDDTALRLFVRNTALAQMGANRSIESAKELIAQTVAGDTYKALAEALVAHKTGGNAIVGGKGESKNESYGAQMEKQIDDLLNKYGVN